MKFAAYAKQLLVERRAGIHPADVTLVYGDRWWDFAQPKICIKPAEFEPGKYDFCMLAGTRVTVIDQLNEGCDLDGTFYALLSELAAAGALVVVQWPPNTEPPTSSALEIAEGLRRLSPDAAWPRWWNNDLDNSQREMFYGWRDDRRRAAHAKVNA